MTNTDEFRVPSNCDHEWEFSDQSEPHKGREYYGCRKCEVVAIINGDEIAFVPNYDLAE